MKRKEDRQKESLWKRLSPKNWTQLTYVVVFSVIGVLFIGGTALVFGNDDLDRMGFPDEKDTVEIDDSKVKDALNSEDDGVKTGDDGKKDDGVQSVSDDGADKDNSGKLEDRDDTKDKDAAVGKKASDKANSSAVKKDSGKSTSKQSSSKSPVN